MPFTMTLACTTPQFGTGQVHSYLASTLDFDDFDDTRRRLGGGGCTDGGKLSGSATTLDDELLERSRERIVAGTATAASDSASL